ncbi:LON peptidase substrate-binding domain-containing protein [Luteimonas sp. RD2P54]|uniref:LON peptidase substrate-binding domain-containing protein n=1 Tax=Luteimonas endophytica TaxID=3042023 RepID=A0ABT6J7Z3_9GAMM|nr:LON peptidase substrate-binding domain-containing protein [Luteimonas endophytica]MDH5822936.1 LON peptidase substrate-binding domain-containing protein [Luteimonas endophytica]
MSEPETLPLFPLHSVLVPGAALGLRIFEPRYLDLVRDCGRSGGSFGICLILDGEEAGAPASPAAYGTEALIEDFDRGADGLLSLRVRGARRFRVCSTRVRDNGLVVAGIAWQDDDPRVALLPEHALLAELLRRILEHAGAAVSAVPKARFDDAGWVGWRLAELLPLEDAQRQALLQEADPHRRLQRLLEFVS